MKRLQLNAEQIVIHNDGTVEDNVKDYKVFLKEILMMLIEKGLTTDQIASIMKPFLVYIRDNNKIEGLKL